MRISALFFAAILGLLAAPRAEACSCGSPDLVQLFRAADRVFEGRVVGVHRGGYWNAYDVVVTDPLTSCLAPRRVVQVGTSTSSCGVRLAMGGRYVLFTNGQVVQGRTRLITDACSGDRLISSLTADEDAFLQSRPTECGGVWGCVDGSQPVSCAVDPCAVVPSCDPNATCEANYCVGCGAEFYDADDAAVCTPW